MTTTTYIPETTIVKHLRAKFAGTCAICERRFPQGAEIVWIKGPDKPISNHEACWADFIAPAEHAPEDHPQVSSWTGEKLGQWCLYAETNEFWDGEEEITEAAARYFHEQWEAGTWKTIPLDWWKR